MAHHHAQLQVQETRHSLLASADPCTHVAHTHTLRRIPRHIKLICAIKKYVHRCYACIILCIMCVPGVCGGQMRESDPVEREFQMFVSHHLVKIE